jgi:GH15 family glucan-1,4-alpha-glucosidase
MSTQSYGSTALDASALLMPQVGFLPADDERIVATVEAVQDELLVDGFVMRYLTSTGVDGLAGHEGAFLPCTLWLADCLALMGRNDEARDTFKRVAGLVNDVGLISEEYDVANHRLVGNFPQAFTHVGIINTARRLAAATPPEQRFVVDRDDDDRPPAITARSSLLQTGSGSLAPRGCVAR